jgi:hypothetical protein
MQQMSVSALPSALYKLEMYVRAIFISGPILFGLFFLRQLINGLSEVLQDASGQPQKSIYDLLPLVFITLVWNSIVISGIWDWLVKPLIYRRLVMCGQPTVGRITGASLGSKTCTISYQFFPEKGIPALGKAEVPLNIWQELGGLNAEITVLYFPQRDRWNVPYRCSGYEVIAAA